MKGLVLANIDYLRHTSTEGNELQEGLCHAGWTLAGPGYDGIFNVGELLDRYRPDRVFVQDVRDWLRESNISFRKDLSFERLDLLGASGIPSFTIIKDSWGWHPEQSRLVSQIQARAIACYYRCEMVKETAPWITRYPLVRIHHSVDADLARGLMNQRMTRKPGLVSGFLQPCYPLRNRVFENASRLGLDIVRHPGYGNRGADTPNYLTRLADYKVHVATTSKWGCAFRKLIESVACGVTPITNLPASDVLPEIDEALVRVPDNISLPDLKLVIDHTVQNWTDERSRYFSEKACAYYDWRVSGERLSELLSTYVQHTSVA